MKKVGKTTRPFRYDLNQIPYDYTVEVRNRFKGLDPIDRVPDELWNEVRDIDYLSPLIILASLDYLSPFEDRSRMNMCVPPCAGSLVLVWLQGVVLIHGPLFHVIQVSAQKPPPQGGLP